MAPAVSKSVLDDDSDLEDLLGNKGNNDTNKTASLNLDHLTKGKLDVPGRRTFGGPNVANVASAHCRYLCYMYPRCCGFLSVMTVGMVMFFMIGAVLNPTETFGVIKNDYTDIQSEYDLSLGKIDHWCLKGDNDSCRCEDPLEPNSRVEYKSWNAAHKANKKAVEAYRDSEMLDVAFIGESLVEEMDGRWMGRAQGDELKGVEKSFKKQFKRDKSGMEGVALGIAGDTSPNVLWRLLHGEMPADFNPRVWWVVLGMNDLGRMQCSEEVVVLGILRVVEEIRSRKPDAKIVINSMLPMADLRGGVYPQMTDYKDAFRQNRGRGGRMGRNPNVNPALYGMGSAGAGGGSTMAGADGMATISYTRPTTTTAALRNRRKDNFRGGALLPPGAIVPPGGIGGGGPGGMGPSPGAMGPPPGAMAGVTVKKQPDDGRKLKKKESSDDEGGAETPKKTKTEKKMEKKYMKKIKKDPVNPKLNLDLTKIKARDPKKLYMKKNRLPLWTSINSINNELRKFASKDKEITFYDATEHFAERGEGRKYVLRSDRISIRGHPNQAGFEAWEDGIATKLTKMFKADDEGLAVEVKATEDAKAAEEAKKKEDEAKNVPTPPPVADSSSSDGNDKYSNGKYDSDSNE